VVLPASTWAKIPMFLYKDKSADIVISIS